MPLFKIAILLRHPHHFRLQFSAMASFDPIPNLLLLLLLSSTTTHSFDLSELTIDSIQLAFQNGSLTSRDLVSYYLNRIQTLNPLFHSVIELNPDAVLHADRADAERRAADRSLSPLHGIPVLLKDVISTRDRLNTTAGSLALLGSVVPRDAGVVRRLRRAGAVILGKASLSEWLNFRTFDAPSGWSARGGQGRNPYVLSAYPCGSSSGSAIAAAADMVAVTVGTETDGSILCSSADLSVVGIKPTVGVTGRSGVIPLSPREDTIGPICRTVSDAVHVLDAIAGYDPRDAKVTREASKYIPKGGYRQFLRVDGLKGKRLGILRKGLFDLFPEGSVKALVFDQHFNTMRQEGAILVDNLTIANSDVILNPKLNGEQFVLMAEFKICLNAYLSELPYSPVRTLADVIAFNKKHKVEERLDDIGQSIFLLSQNTSGLGPVEQNAIARMSQLSMDGLETLMREQKLDAVVTPDAYAAPMLAIGGFPGISVPAGYGDGGAPFGICFGGLRGSEPTLIEIAYGFERATKVRKPPTVAITNSVFQERSRQL